jgi:hypothetical protein
MIYTASLPLLPVDTQNQVQLIVWPHCVDKDLHAYLQYLS